MNDKRWIRGLVVLLACGLGLTMGCLDGGGEGPFSKPGLGSAPAPAGEGGEAGGGSFTRGLAMGDGLTKGVGIEEGRRPWPSLIRYQLGVPVPAWTKGGATVADGAAQVQALLEINDPSHVMILLGTNDAVEGTPSEVLRGQYQAIVDAIRQYGAVPLLATLPPLYGFGAEVDGHMNRINRLIRSVAGNNRIGLARLDVEFGSDRSLIQEDGIHPTFAGHTVIMAAFIDLL